MDSWAALGVKEPRGTSGVAPALANLQLQRGCVGRGGHPRGRGLHEDAPHGCLRAAGAPAVGFFPQSPRGPALCSAAQPEKLLEAAQHRWWAHQPCPSRAHSRDPTRPTKR